MAPSSPALVHRNGLQEPLLILKVKSGLLGLVGWNWASYAGNTETALLRCFLLLFETLQRARCQKEGLQIFFASRAHSF